MYKVYNGSEWVDICNCNLNIYGSNSEWINVDPRACQVKFWTGSEWCEIICDVDCLDFLKPGLCEEVSSNIIFDNTVCSTLSGGDCSKLVAYIPISLTNLEEGFTVRFSPFSVYDGLDVVDICNQTVVGGLGMIGSNQFPASTPPHRVSPGVYTYTRKVFYNFATNAFETLTGLPDFTMAFKYPNNCINDWTPTPDPSDTTQICETTGYENLLSQGDPFPSVNEMYLPRIVDSDGNDLCVIPGNLMATVDYKFNRPPAPIGGYPANESFLIRIFGNPLRETQFELNNFTCSTF
jgi:hypothetical protein